jgi:ATP-dependent Clp protease ATP-binding subunit ClpX
MASEPLACSFCGRPQNAVRKLVAGQHAFICNDCVTIAKRAMASDTPDVNLPDGWSTPPPDKPKH